jgi:hypothetical protein
VVNKSVLLQDYFTDALQDKAVKRTKDVTALCNSALQFITQCCPPLANNEGPVHGEIITSIKICCHGYSRLCQLTAVSGSSNLTTFLKTVLYLLSKLSGKVGKILAAGWRTLGEFSD